ncbi:MAG: MMPL family transporter [Candidatus Methanomethylophilaceae archaeon]|nr:MMPL family transporter [Candidatus Methanomethylophilaceae archaeon]
MIFDKLADGITKHAKLIVVIWVIVLIVSAPLALKSGEVMKYDVNDMAGEDSEAVKGLQIISEYYSSSGIDTSSLPIILMKYSTKEEAILSQGFISYLSDHAGLYTDDKGNPKLSLEKPFVSMGAQTKEGLSGGIILAGVVYGGYDGSIIDDTGNLRAFIADMKADYIKSDGASSFENVRVYLTGTTAITNDLSVGALEDISRIDPFTVLLILVLVGLFFRSFVSSGTPPLTIGVAFVVVLALIFGIGQVLNIFFITEMMLLVAMMGAGCDYCIFIIARYREGLRAGLGHDGALHDAIKWAGESIATSGASVMIGFGVMSICSISMVSTMGLCLALGILVALLAALTLIPAILELVRDKIFWPTSMKSFEEGGKATKGWFGWFGRLGERYFDKSSRFSLKHAKAIVVATVLVSVPAAYVAFNAETSYDMISSMQTGESGEGMDLIGQYADLGMFMPNYIPIQSSEPLAVVSDNPLSPGTKVLTWTDTFKGLDIGGLCESIAEDPNVASVSGPLVWDDSVKAAIAYLASQGVADPTGEQIIGAVLTSLPETQALYVMQTVSSMRESGMSDEALVLIGGPSIDYYVNTSSRALGGDFVKTGDGEASFFTVTFSTQAAAMAPVSMKSIDSASEKVDAFMKDVNSEHGSALLVNKWVTGSAAVMYDISKDVSSEFTMIEVLVVVLIVILLFVVMRSYLIPVRSVLTILMSICWTLAMTHFLFTTVMGVDVTWLIPLILLVICLGLGMDYDILLTTRIKENVIKGMSNDDAIHHAVTHTGSVITICGLIMGGAFGTLMLSSMVMLQQFGFALCFAILCDALIVRTYIVPAIMHLLGDLNWKGPRFMQRQGA